MVVDTGCQPLMIRSPAAGRRRLFFVGSHDPHDMPLPIEPEIGDIVFIRVTVRPFRSGERDALVDESRRDRRRRAAASR